MKCADIHLIISQSQDVTNEDASAFEAHVASCPICHAALAQLQSQTDGIFKALGRSESRPPAATLNAIRSTISPEALTSRGRQSPSRIPMVVASLLRLGLGRDDRHTDGRQMRRPLHIMAAALVLMVVSCGVARMGLRQSNPQPITADGTTATAIRPPVADSVPTQTSTLLPIAIATATPTIGSREPSPSNPPDAPMGATPTADTTPRAPRERPDAEPTLVVNPLPTSTPTVVPTIAIPPSSPPTEIPLPTAAATQPPTVVNAPVLPTLTAIATPPGPPTAIATPPGPPTATAIATLVAPTTTVYATAGPPTTTAVATLVPPTITVYATLGPPTAIATLGPPTAIATLVPPTDVATPTPTGTPMLTDTPVPTATPTNAPPPTPTPTPSGRALPVRKPFLTKED